VEPKPTYITEPRDLHILKPWLGIVRRLRSVAGKGSYSAIKIVVLVDCDGEPIKWTNPTVTAIEPRANPEALDSLLRALSE